MTTHAAPTESSSSKRNQGDDSLSTEQGVLQVVLRQGRPVAVTIEHVEDSLVAPLRVVRGLGRQDEAAARLLPGPARGRHVRVGAARRAAMVPNDQHVRAAIAVDDVDQPQAAWPAGHVVHAVTDLKRLAEGGAADLDVEAIGALEDLVSLFDVGPEQAALIVVVEGLRDSGAGAVVIGRPPDLVGP